jgi:hypothetical protein
MTMKYRGYLCWLIKIQGMDCRYGQKEALISVLKHIRDVLAGFY